MTLVIEAITIGYYGIQKCERSVVQKDQLAVAACVRLQLQYMSRAWHKLAQQEVMSNLKGACNSQILLMQTTMREEKLHRLTIRNIFEWMNWRKLFWKVHLAFWRIVCFPLNIIFCIQQLTLSNNALRHVLHIDFIALWTLSHFVYKPVEL